MKPLPLRELLGVLVADLVVAETHAAKATADFLREAGFIGGKKTKDDWGRLRFVSFSYGVEDPDGKKVRIVSVPLLSLLPIPLQQIDQAEYEFFAQVNDVTEIDPAPNASYELGSRAYGLAQPFSDLLCEVAPYPTDSEGEKRAAIPKVRVKLTMRQADLPAGLSSSLRRIEQASGSKTR